MAVNRAVARGQEFLRKRSSECQEADARRGHPLPQVQRVQRRRIVTTQPKKMPGFVGYLSILLIFASVIGPALV
jgi:hypothetical protein